MLDSERIAVIGLGYVGLPVAVALANKFASVVGFDISERRVATLVAGNDWTNEVATEELRASGLTITADATTLTGRTFFIVTVPTPIDADLKPDLGPVRDACAIVGPYLSPGAVVVFESTVYPGVTDDICAPLLEKASGLTRGIHFTLGYSPERINPGDREHRLESIVKVIAAEDAATLARLRVVYGAVITAGLHEAPTIKTAEAAKVIENTQRDLNIALMNELAIILGRLGVSTRDVLDAAGTKWNFLKFSPGLVGGHCIGVDPYYLTHLSETLGYKPDVILAGRRVNNGMGRYVADQALALISERSMRESRRPLIGILGLTFKENVPDLRNSRVPDILQRLTEAGAEVLIHDPLADRAEARFEYGVELSSPRDWRDLDALILAVSHSAYLDDIDQHFAAMAPDGVVIDVRSAIDRTTLPKGIRYWSL